MTIFLIIFSAIFFANLPWATNYFLIFFEKPKKNMFVVLVELIVFYFIFGGFLLLVEKQVVGKGDFFTFNVKGNEYGEKVDEGTPAGSSPNINDIITWINNKPVTLLDASQNKLSNITEKGKTRIASLIAQKINKEGIKPTNFLTDLVNKEIDKILGISTEIVKDINLDIDGFMQKLGYSKQGNTFKLHK